MPKVLKRGYVTVRGMGVVLGGGVCSVEGGHVVNSSNTAIASATTVTTADQHSQQQ